MGFSGAVSSAFLRARFVGAFVGVALSGFSLLADVRGVFVFGATFFVVWAFVAVFVAGFAGAGFFVSAFVVFGVAFAGVFTDSLLATCALVLRAVGFDVVLVAGFGWLAFSAGFCATFCVVGFAAGLTAVFVVVFVVVFFVVVVVFAGFAGAFVAFAFSCVLGACLGFFDSATFVAGFLVAVAFGSVAFGVVFGATFFVVWAFVAVFVAGFAGAGFFVSAFVVFGVAFAGVFTDSLLATCALVLRAVGFDVVLVAGFGWLAFSAGFCATFCVVGFAAGLTAVFVVVFVVVFFVVVVVFAGFAGAFVAFAFSCVLGACLGFFDSATFVAGFLVAVAFGSVAFGVVFGATFFVVWAFVAVFVAGFAGAGFFVSAFVVFGVAFAGVFTDSLLATCALVLRVAGFDVVLVAGFVSRTDFGCLSSFLVLIVSPLSEFPIGFVLVDVFWQNLCNQQFFVFAQKAFHSPAWRDKERIAIKLPCRLATICPDSVGAQHIAAVQKCAALENCAPTLLRAESRRRCYTDNIDILRP